MIDVKFIDRGYEAREKPDPNYPSGKPISLLTSPLQKSCTRNLPHPAPRCGYYSILCNKCGFSALITVAGRPDDPNMVTLPCKLGGLDG